MLRSVASSAGSLPCSEPRAVSELMGGVFLAGFESSCHRLEDGRRLDLQRSTRHLELAELDYAALRRLGISTCREAVSWVHAEPRRGRFDFSHAKRLLQAAQQNGMRIVWDLMHFGWPDEIDVFATDFPQRFGAYARAFAHFLANESGEAPVITPVNEISFLSWAGADVAVMNPFVYARGVELTVQLVRATIEAIEGLPVVAARYALPAD